MASPPSLAAVLAAVAGLAASARLCPATAHTLDSPVTSRPCGSGDLNGAFIEVDFQETPTGGRTNLVETFPYQYLQFNRDNSWVRFATNSAQTDDLIKQRLSSPTPDPQTQKYELGGDDVLTLYKRGVIPYDSSQPNHATRFGSVPQSKFECSVITEASASYQYGDLILKGSEAGYMPEERWVYRRWPASSDSGPQRCNITSITEEKVPGTDESRQTVGVGEVVDLMTQLASPSWTLVSGGGNLQPTSWGAIFTSPYTRSQSVIRAVANGAACSIPLNVIPPSGIQFYVLQGPSAPQKGYDPGNDFIGFWAAVFIKPASVSFKNVLIAELDKPNLATFPVHNRLATLPDGTKGWWVGCDKNTQFGQSTSSDYYVVYTDTNAHNSAPFATVHRTYDKNLLQGAQTTVLLAKRQTQALSSASGKLVADIGVEAAFDIIKGSAYRGFEDPLAPYQCTKTVERQFSLTP